jgi:integrase
LGELRHDENVWVGLFSRIYDGNMPPLRIGDWRNAYVGKSDTMNEINLKDKIMIRRIKKNQKKDTEDIIPLSGTVVHFIYASHIKGELFPNMSVTEIDNMIKRVMPDKTATPHYWRSYYTVNVLSKLTSKKEIKERLRIMDHSLEVNAAYYNKQSSSAYNSLLAEK